MKILKVFSLFVFALVLTACSSLLSSGGSDSATPQIGQAASDFTLLTQDGERVSLEDYAGKKIYLNIWASWCGPCKREMPELEGVYQSYKDKEDVVFLSVVSASDDKYANSQPADASEAEILAVAQEQGITYPILFDSEDNFMSAYSVRAFPTQLVINSDGTISAYVMGSITASSLEKLLEEAY